MLDKRIVLSELKTYIESHNEIKSNSSVIFEIDSNNDIVSFCCPDFDLCWLCEDYQYRKIALVYNSILSDLLWHIENHSRKLFNDFR